MNILHIIWEELTAGLPNGEELLRVTVRLVVAMLLGAVVGVERERAGKDAGLRTHMLVALGSALFVLVPSEAGLELGDLTRVIQGVATGIGFIGAGSILKLNAERDIQGLTTAAGLWVTAAMGVAAGLGRLGAAILSVLLALVTLNLLLRLDFGSGKRPHARRSPASQEPQEPRQPPEPHDALDS